MASKGFLVQHGELGNPSRTEKDILSRLEVDCGLRKGSKHR